MTEPTSRAEMKATLQGEPERAVLTKAEADEIMIAVHAACRSRAAARAAMKDCAQGRATQAEKDEAWVEYRQDLMRVEKLLYSHTEGGYNGSAD